MGVNLSQYKQTRFESHVTDGTRYFDKSRTSVWPYGWMARMQFDKAAHHSPARADVIGKFYLDNDKPDVAARYFAARLNDASCHHDPAAWLDLASALDKAVQGTSGQARQAPRLAVRAQNARDEAARLSQPAVPPTPQDALKRP